MNVGGRPESALLDPAFVRELEALRRRLDIRARSGGAGEHLAKRRGGSAEFHEHRAYAPGDDLRRMDWAAYARTGEPVLKLFRAEEDVVVRLVCDASASLGACDAEGRSKLGVAKRLAAAIGFMALARSERASILPASSLRTNECPPVRGRAGLPALLRSLDAIEAAGGTDLARAIDRVVRQSARPGMLVVISDFFDPGPVCSALRRAAAGGHDVALIQVLTPDEIEPTFEGDLALEDAETGEVVEVTIDASAVEAYLARLASLSADLRSLAKATGGTFLRVRTDAALDEAVRRFVARSVDA